jgi:hypothetical protein
MKSPGPVLLLTTIVILVSGAHAVFAVPGTIVFPLPTPVRARLGLVYHADVRSHGVRLSLTLPQRTYPQDALVRVIVRLENISRRIVQVGGVGAAVCDRRSPGIRVTGADNQVLYPPAIAWMLPSCGPSIMLRLRASLALELCRRLAKSSRCHG